MRSFEAEFFAFRVPALPLEVLTRWGEDLAAPSGSAEELPGALEHDRGLLGARLMEIVHRPEVMGALSVASPDLLDALRERPEDPATRAALTRYVSRMASRPTPFGLFAACGVGEIGERTRIALPEPTAWKRHTRLDGDYLDRVLRARAGELRDRLTFRPNDSMYRLGDRRRYVEVRFDRLERTHHLAEVRDSRHLRAALQAAHEGALASEIAAAVEAGGVEAEAAARYVRELIDAQVLLPTLAITITGTPPLDGLIADLRSLGDDGTVAILEAVGGELAAIDAEGASAAPERHGAIAAQLGELPVPESRSRLLQVDATVPECGATLARSAVEDVVRGIELLRRLAPPREPTELVRFIEAFEERYERREVPLLEALDDDAGVGYGSGGGDPAPLIKGLPRPRQEPKAQVGRRARRLLVLLHRAWEQHVHEVALDPEDIEELTSSDPPELPAAIGAVASIARTREGPRVILSYAAGPAGAELLGRFCHADPRMAEHVRAHLRAEETLAPEVVHAEIVHLPSGLMSNILVRPVLREWELEWLGRSGAPREKRLSASDLLVSVRRGRVVLRSASLDREVVPRLTSAHNTLRRSPAVYRFLAAVASQGTEPIGWSWAPYDRAPFTPRIRSGRLILARAAWWLAAAELRELEVRDPVSSWRAVQAWRAHRRLPRWICLVDGDNKLVVDLDNVVSVETLVRALRAREEAQIEELYPGPEELVATGPDGKRALELVIPLVRAAPTAAEADRTDTASRSVSRVRAPSEVRRTFEPGSEWTYLKLYTGSASADSLLREEIAPLARELISAGAADRWFFLRYADPRFHIRLRFHGPPEAIVRPVQELAARALETGLAYDAELATYQREIERYGGPEAIELAERHFHADSDAVVSLLGMFDSGQRGLDERWRIGALGAALLLRDFGIDQHEAPAYARRQQVAFERELRADARLRKAVAQRVRSEQAAVEELLGTAADGEHPLAPGISVLAERSERIAATVAELRDLRAAGRLDAPLNEIVGSHVHMWLNRLCRSENRFQEYVTYALLARVLQARAARVRS
jgi:thiopeptide-type bacteriocin biosynthesis protein